MHTEIPAKAPLDPPEQGRMFGAWAILILLTVCYTFSVIDRYVISYVAVNIKQDLNLSDVQLGLLQGFVFAIFYAVAGIPLGWAVDRYVRKNLIGGAVALWSSMTMACGLVKSFTGLALARIGVGAGEAVLSPATYSMLPDLFGTRKLPMAMAVYALGAVGASAAAAAISGYILSHGGEAGLIAVPFLGKISAWRVVFLVAGAPGLLLAVLAFLIREPVRRKLVSNLRTQTEPSQLVSFIKQNWKTHVIYCLAMTLTTLMSYALNSWTPSVFSRTYGWSPVQIGETLGPITFFGGIIGCAIGGIIATWCVRTGRVASFLMIALGAVVVMGVFGLLTPFMKTGQGFAILLTGAYIASPLMFMISPTLLQMITPADLRGRMSAVFLFVNIGIGAGAGPIIVGALSTYVFRSDHFLGAALGASIAATALICAVMILFLFRPISEYVAHKSIS